MSSLVEMSAISQSSDSQVFSVDGSLKGSYGQDQSCRPSITAVELAACLGLWNTVELLLDKSTSTGNNKGDGGIFGTSKFDFSACRSPHIRLCPHPLEMASRAGQLSIVKRLLTLGSDPAIGIRPAALHRDFSVLSTLVAAVPQLDRWILDHARKATQDGHAILDDEEPQDGRKKSVAFMSLFPLPAVFAQSTALLFASDVSPAAGSPHQRTEYMERVNDNSTRGMMDSNGVQLVWKDGIRTTGLHHQPEPFTGSDDVGENGHDELPKRRVVVSSSRTNSSGVFYEEPIVRSRQSWASSNCLFAPNCFSTEDGGSGTDTLTSTLESDQLCNLLVNVLNRKFREGVAQCKLSRGQPGPVADKYALSVPGLISNHQICHLGASVLARLIDGLLNPFNDASEDRNGVGVLRKEGPNRVRSFPTVRFVTLLEHGWGRHTFGDAFSFALDRQDMRMVREMVTFWNSSAGLLPTPEEVDCDTDSRPLLMPAAATTAAAQSTDLICWQHEYDHNYIADTHQQNIPEAGPNGKRVKNYLIRKTRQVFSYAVKATFTTPLLLDISCRQKLARSMGGVATTDEDANQITRYLLQECCPVNGLFCPQVMQVPTDDMCLVISPLSWAIRCENDSVVKMLLDHGADPLQPVLLDLTWASKIEPKLPTLFTPVVKGATVSASAGGGSRRNSGFSDMKAKMRRRGSQVKKPVKRRYLPHELVVALASSKQKDARQHADVYDLDSILLALISKLLAADARESWFTSPHQHSCSTSELKMALRGVVGDAQPEEACSWEEDDGLDDILLHLASHGLWRSFVCMVSSGMWKHSRSAGSGHQSLFLPALCFFILGCLFVHSSLFLSRVLRGYAYILALE
jgi:hypothetical protein